VILLFCFFLGIANFALHRAVLESRHPFVEDSKLYFGRHIGRHGSYVLEFLILAGAMIFAASGSILIAAFYGIYSAFNAVAAWMLLSRKI
jgi:hypothetical protein